MRQARSRGPGGVHGIGGGPWARGQLATGQGGPKCIYIYIYIPKRSFNCSSCAELVASEGLDSEVPTTCVVQ